MVAFAENLKKPQLYVEVQGGEIVISRNKDARILDDSNLKNTVLVQLSTSSKAGGI